MIDPFEHSPWDFWTRADASAQQAQLETQRTLAAEHTGYAFGEGCFVSELASIDNDLLELGDRSYVAAGAYLTGSLRTGRDCSMNPYTVIRGDIVMGDAVRIGAHTSILGFNHTMSDTALEVFRQPLTSRGIRIGDDVWVGSHVVILDGVRIGDHAVLAAGAIVTKDVPDGAIVGGNPARFIRWRVPPVADTVGVPDLADRVAAFAARAREQAAAVLARSWDPELERFVDRPGAAPTVRAQCDAVEIADLLLDGPPPQGSAQRQLDRLKGWQDAGTGAVGQLGADGSLTAGGWSDPDTAYHVLCVHYALDLLGGRFASPLGLVSDLSASDVPRLLDGLPWASEPWTAGHWVDAVGTAMHASLRGGLPLQDGAVDALFGWLLRHADPGTGMWGSPAPDGDLLQVVNGFYRTVRGTFAQFGVPIPYPEQVIDTVLRHVAHERFARENQDACNVLDVAYPLWLTRATGHRAAEVVAVATSLLEDALQRWDDGEGIAFGAGGESRRQVRGHPGLQGTEMWLAIVWYLSDIAGVSDAVGFRPRGVHRPGPVQPS